jgi:hypothetical protein
MQILFVHSSEGPQIRPERGPRSLAGVAVDLASAIPIVIPRPLMHAVADGGMAWVAPPIALPLIGIEQRAARRKVLRDQGRAGARVCMVADPPALLPRLTRDHADDGWAVIGIGTVPLPFIGTSAWRIARVAMGRTFFPQRSGRVHRPQRRCRPSPWWVRSRPSWLGCAAVACGAACVRHPIPARGVPWTGPWQSRAAAAPRWLGAGAFSRRRSPLAGCNNPGRPDSGRPESGLGRGTGAARGAHSVGISVHPGGDAVRAKACRCCHPVTRRSESLS